MADAQTFYPRIAPIRDFLQFGDPRHYVRAPEDWLVVVTDVQGSTRAIEEGKYKLVNLIGASSIVALVNALGTQEFPFVFGGDGATAMVPATALDKVERALRAARARASGEFGLKLRVGIIPHGDLIREGAPVQVARFELSSGASIAFFRGEGLALAEKWVKSGRGEVSDGPALDPTEAMNGLSCRWAPLKSKRGVIVAILAKARAKGPAADTVLDRIVRRLDAIVDLESPDAHPIKTEALRPEGIWKAARAEIKVQGLRPPWFHALRIMFQIVVVKIVRKFRIRIGKVDLPRYISSLSAHSDYRKYDETIRMVVDCSPEMRDRVREMLEKERADGAIYFGVHESDSALMTCFMKSLDDRGHLHFVDGGDGGYAMSAKGLKAQMGAGG